MTDTRLNTPSVADRTRGVDVGAPVVGVHFLGDTAAAFVLAEEALVLASQDGAPRRCQVHGGAILSAVADGERVITSGDDGKVVSTSASGDSTVIATDAKRRWIDHVAVARDGAVAWSAGKQAFVLAGKDVGKSEPRMLEVPSTVGALAFAPKGFRLAIAHYNGATLWFPNAKAEPERLDWKGSHLAATISPDGRFLVTAMQEAMLHGWRIVDRKDMRMQGYTARVRSLDWTADGKWLATSGSTQLILWPFQAKDGPMGKTPQLLAPTDQQVETVACHPKQPVVAVGYADGLILLVRLDDGAEVLAKSPGDAPVSALAWNQDGRLLAFGTEGGEAGVLYLS
jgi:WD40 repeat protein